jgi:sulfatase modifying factor 1
LVGAAVTGLGGLAVAAVLARGTQDLSPDSIAGAVTEPVKPALKAQWELLRQKHWRIVSPPGEAPATTDAAEGTRGVCAEGMVEVRGQMKLDPSKTAAYDGNSVEELQKTTCTKWINRDYPERCAEFDREKWLKVSEKLATKPMHFCIDRFEYPNRKGEYPVIYVTYPEAQALCKEQGKRLCDEHEWTFACEGDEAYPYPVGYKRDPDACVQDRMWRAFNENAMQPRDGDAARAEMDRLWQGVASGSRERCRSVFGVYDMTGNVDEWTTSVRPGERPSILKGGYWGPVRTRCRPSTRSHDESHAFYQQGFRCCADAPGEGTAVADAGF